MRKWLAKVGVKTLFITPGSPWENGYNESFTGRLRNDVLKGEIFHSLREARIVIESWRALLQHDPAPRFVGLQATSTRGDYLALARSGLRY